MKAKTKKILINLSVIIASILLIMVVFFAAYTYFMNQSVSSYSKLLKKYSQEITDINQSTGSLIKGETIEDKKAKNELEDKINKLLKIKESVDILNPAEKFRESHGNFTAGLNSNIYIYKQIVQIVNNPQAKDAENALVALKKYKDECINYYSLVNIKNVSISLSSKATTFVDNTSYYLGESIKLRKKNEIAQGLNSDFLNSLDELVTLFLPIKTDYTAYAVMGRNKSFAEALAKVDSNKATFDDIKSKLSKIIVPSSGITVFKTLSKTLNTEEKYIQGFRYALNIERMQAITAPLKPAEIQQLYLDTDNLLKDVNSNYDDFLKLYTAFKNK